MTVFERVVVGVDGRAGGRDALVLASLLRGFCGGALTAVYAYPFDRTVALDRAGAVEAVLEEDLRATVEAELARCGVDARPLVVAEGAPARALQAIAERDRAGLIVVGTRELSHVERMLGYSVSEGVQRMARCDVLIVHS